MHINYRRKNPKGWGHKCLRGRWGLKSKKEYQRLGWAKLRAQVRDLMTHEEYDGLYNFVYETILWDWY